MLYQKDGINYLTFAEKMWIELCSNKSSIKKNLVLFYGTNHLSAMRWIL